MVFSRRRSKWPILNGKEEMRSEKRLEKDAGIQDFEP